MWSLARTAASDMTVLPCISQSACKLCAASAGQDVELTSLGYEQEDLILEDNGCPGVQGARLHGPGGAQPFTHHDFPRISSVRSGVVRGCV